MQEKIVMTAERVKSFLVFHWKIGWNLKKMAKKAKDEAVGIYSVPAWGMLFKAPKITFSLDLW